MKHVCLISILMLTACIARSQTPAASPSEPSKPAEPPAVRSFDPAAMDLTADPCADFYQYACGNWMKQNPIPADQTRWVRSFSLLQQRNQYLLWKDLDSAAASPQDALQKQYGDFYASCMDTATIEKLGLQPIQPAWNEIAGLKSASELPRLARPGLRSQGTPDGFFDFGVDAGREGLVQADRRASTRAAFRCPTATTTSSTSPHFAQIRAQYIEHMKKMFTLAGDTPDQAAKEAAAVMEIETAMAKASMSRADLRDPEKLYHIYTVDDFQKLTPGFDWKTYFQGIGIGHFDTLNVATPDFFKALDALHRERAARLLEELSALACASRPGAQACPRPSSMRTSLSSAKRWPGRRSPCRAGSSAPWPPTALWAKPSARTG